MPGLLHLGEKAKAKTEIGLPVETARVAETDACAGMQEASRRLACYKAWLNEIHLEFARIPAPTFFEERRAMWFIQKFQEFGWCARKDKAGNVVASRDPSFTGPFVALTAHLDTVLTPRQPADVHYGPDGKLYGPGVADNGAGLLALLAVARLIHEVPSLPGAHRNVLLVANVGEEGEGNLSGMRYLCRQSPLASKIPVFLVLDGPHLDNITTEALASRRFEITFSGPGGHSWSDAGAANPVHALARTILLFLESRPETPAESPRSAVNFGWIEGGATVNSIPTLARAKLDIRSESAAQLEELSALIAAVVERARALETGATGGKLAARIREIGSRPGGKLEPTSPLFRLLRAIDAHLGIRSHTNCASTDANIPLSMGIPAVSIGAGGQGGGAHTPSEWYSAEGRETGLRRVLLALALLTAEVAA